MEAKRGVSPLRGYHRKSTDVQVLRRPAVNTVTGVLFVAVGVLMLGGLGSGNLGIAVALGVPGLAIICLGVRYFVIRVEIGQYGLDLHNIWRNYQFSWDEIVEIVPATRGSVPRPIGVKTTTGRIVRFTGISPGRGERPSVSDGWLDVVEANHAAYKQRTNPSGAAAQIGDV